MSIKPIALAFVWEFPTRKLVLLFALLIPLTFGEMDAFREQIQPLEHYITKGTRPKVVKGE
jgi:hypothetical protein